MKLREVWIKQSQMLENEKCRQIWEFCHSDLVISTCLPLETKHTWVKYEGSMINHRQKIQLYDKWLSLKNIGYIDLIFHVHIRGIYVYVWVRCDISMIKSEARRTVPQTMPTPTTITPDDNTRWTIHDYIGSLAFMPNEPESTKKAVDSHSRPWTLTIPSR